MIKTVFCEFEFLKDFFKSIPTLNQWNDLLSWKQTFDFLYYARKYVDVPLEELAKVAKDEKEKGNPYFLKLLKNSVTYRKDFLNMHCPGSTELDIEKKNSFFLTAASTEDRKKMSSSYGIITIGKEDVLNFSRLFSPVNRSVRKKNEYKWKDLMSKELQISNSMIISDNYILSDTEMMRENLKDILDILLPSEAVSCYPIFVYTDDMRKQEQNRCKMLYEIIEELRPKLNFTLTVCKVYKNQTHDRHIITNNVYISCASGFNLFSKGKALKTTDLKMAYPFMFHNIDGKDEYQESYLNNILDFIDIEKMNHTYRVDFWGDEKRKNYIIEYYKVLLGKLK